MTSDFVSGTAEGLLLTALAPPCGPNSLCSGGLEMPLTLERAGNLVHESLCMC